MKHALYHLPLMKISLPSLCFVVLAGLSPAATFRVWDPSPYRSELDSPFYPGIQSGSIFLEDFEDGSLNTPFVRDPLTFPQEGITFRTQNPNVSDSRVASVDGDDGVLDFEGNLGDSWITYQTGGAGRRSFFEFEFLPNAEGQYPTYVGFVVTEVAEIDSSVKFEILAGDSFDDFERGYRPRDWFNGNRRGDVETHRFIGIYAEEGIRQIYGDNVYQVDHLQYGYAIPEASTVLLSLSAITFTLVRRRRASCHLDRS